MALVWCWSCSCISQNPGVEGVFGLLERNHELESRTCHVDDACKLRKVQTLASRSLQRTKSILKETPFSSSQPCAIRCNDHLSIPSSRRRLMSFSLQTRSECAVFHAQVGHPPRSTARSPDFSALFLNILRNVYLAVSPGLLI